MTIKTDRLTSQIQFGTCTLDLESRRLLRDARDVHITPKAFELLKVLLEHAPKALTKAELLDHLWPNTFVSDDALARLISDLRVAIGDSARQPTVIRTVHGFGYSFAAEVRNDNRRPRRTPCKLTWASHDFPLTEGENVIGRDPDVAVPINALTVSRRHARVVITDGVARIEDLNSKNGTYVANERLTAARPLRDGDTIKIGEYELAFRVVIDDLPTVTRQP
jgi:DNA-binding winged helix-turn-helix (wHTH) protein